MHKTTSGNKTSVSYSHGNRILFPRHQNYSFPKLSISKTPKLSVSKTPKLSVSKTPKRNSISTPLKTKFCFHSTQNGLCFHSSQDKISLHLKRNSVSTPLEMEFCFQITLFYKPQHTPVVQSYPSLCQSLDSALAAGHCDTTLVVHLTLLSNCLVGLLANTDHIVLGLCTVCSAHDVIS
jgi:hypothetical protein